VGNALRKRRQEKATSILPASFKRLCRLKSASEKLNVVPPEELEKFKKSSFIRFCFRPKRLMAAIKNVLASSGLRKTLLKVKRS
jgi:hypothetical protein